MPDMRVLVSGSRDWTDKAAIRDALETAGATVVIHGAARGADALADAVALELGIAREAVPADWTRYGRSAGIRRNELMVETRHPDLVLAFPLPASRGTRHLIAYARRRGIPVLVCGEDF